MQPDALWLNIPFPTQPHQLHYYRWGNTGASIICVHGLTRNSHDFDFLADALAAHHQVLCPDMPGRGKSSWLTPEHYNYATYIFDLQQLLASLHISRVHWIGTSMGGILGMMMANTAPGLIQSLVLNDVGTVIPKAGLERILSYAGARMAFDNRIDAETELRSICAPFGIRDERHWQHMFNHSLETATDGKIRFAYDPAIIQGLPPRNMISDVDLRPMWEAVKPIPTLLIRGEQSDILTRETAHAMQASHPRLTYKEIPGAGHAPMLMENDQIAIISDWLATV